MTRLILTGLMLAAATASAQNCRVRSSWPTAEWPENKIDAVAKADALRALDEALFTLEGAPEERKGYRTNGLVVVKGGAVVFEKYARGWDESKRHLSWSVAKSVSSTLIAIAVRQGLMSLDDSLCKHLTEYASDSELCAITVRNVLGFGSGLQWQEEYEDQGYQVSSVISMLFGAGHHNQVKHVVTHRKLHAPGTQFNYSTGDAHVIGTVAKRVLTAKHGPDAFWSQLFEPIGMKNVVFEEDSSGNALGGSFVYARPRDFAKFGYLMLNDGCWDGQRLLPEGWVRDATTPSEAFKASRGDCSGEKKAAGEYRLPCEETPNGFMWWLNLPPAPGVEKPFKDTPDDAYSALGHWGQRIIVIPSEDLVIVRVGDDREGSIPVNTIVKAVLPLVKP